MSPEEKEAAELALKNCPEKPSKDVLKTLYLDTRILQRHSIGHKPGTQSLTIKEQYDKFKWISDVSTYNIFYSLICTHRTYIFST